MTVKLQELHFDDSMQWYASTIGSDCFCSVLPLAQERRQSTGCNKNNKKHNPKGCDSHLWFFFTMRVKVIDGRSCRSFSHAQPPPNALECRASRVQHCHSATQQLSLTLATVQTESAPKSFQLTTKSARKKKECLAPLELARLPDVPRPVPAAWSTDPLPAVLPWSCCHQWPAARRPHLARSGSRASGRVKLYGGERIPTIGPCKCDDDPQSWSLSRNSRDDIYSSDSQFKARVNGNDAKRHVFVRAHAETGRFHALHELVLARELTNGLDEVSAVRISEWPQTKGCQGGSNGKIDLCKRQSDDAKFVACSCNKNALV
jgi:hypothetical protein